MAYISYSSITVSFDTDEIWRLVIALRERLKGVIGEKHYLTHPDSLNVNHGEDIKLFRQLSGAIGRTDVYESTMAEVEKWLAEVKAKQGLEKAKETT